MKKNIIAPVLFAALSIIALPSCKQGAAEKANEEVADTIATAPPLVGDSAINRALRFYAGLSSDGIAINGTDSLQWGYYSNTIKSYIARTARNRAMVDSIARNDFADFRDSVDYVFYPFSGADFIYPATIFPDADTYFLCGLEKTGSPIGSEVRTNYAHYQAYSKALEYFFRASYFITKYMSTDFHNDELDGVCPVITMLMATADREIISIKHKAFDENGSIIDADDKSDLLEIKFFRSGSNHEQTLYYASGNVVNNRFDERMKKYLDATLPKHRVGSYLKAASYLMHHDAFSAMRDYVLNYSQAVVEDDSGIPYHFFTPNFDVTLYGIYKRPLADFGPECYQTDLQEVYNRNARSIHPLPFRIGYNNPSNWLCARRKK